MKVLAELRVENFAIIDKLTIEFDSGLTVITGETGAGKSIIIDAISLLVGGRGSYEYVRHGADKADIEALFLIDPNHPSTKAAKAIGIDVEDNMIILRRQISSSGKSICRINGKLVTLTVLKDVGKSLIDIHGQHEHQDLMLTDKHLALLDRFGGHQLKEVFVAYTKQYGIVSSLYNQYLALTKNEQETARRLDLIQYQLNEISDANLEEDEEERLIDEKNKLANYERLFQAAQTSYDALYGDGKALDWIGQAMSELEHVSKIDGDLHTNLEAISSCYYLLEENVYGLRDRLENLEYQPERLDEIEARLNDIILLKKKYGHTIKDILSYYEQIENEYDHLINKDQNIEKLEKEMNDQLNMLRHEGIHLSKIRRDTAKKLTNSINHELKDLYMEKARFAIGFKEVKETSLMSFHDFHKQGLDKIEFQIATNPGEPLKPLVKVASGGELSRIMLAIKSNFKEVQGITSIIFDEVDTGVSGRVAQAMAEKIYDLSNASQVFCITHLPQVAAMADHHLFISKKTKNARTITAIEKLINEKRVVEIGRMISGVEVTALTKEHAQELLQLAEEIKT